MDIALAHEREARAHRNAPPRDVPSHSVKPASELNVGKLERAVSAATGGALALLGLKRRGLSGFIMAAIGGGMVYRGVSGHCSLYQALGLNTAADNKDSDYVWERGIRLEKTISIDRPRAEVYQFWRKLENLPRFMNHLESVKTVGPQLSHWVAKGPAGTKVEWGAQIINDIDNELIAWKSLKDADVDTAGSVHFEEAPNGRGTQVRVNLQYNPPAGALGMMFAKLFGEEPEQQIEQDLCKLKEVMEGGQVQQQFNHSRN